MSRLEEKNRFANKLNHLNNVIAITIYNTTSNKKITKQLFVHCFLQKNLKYCGMRHVCSTAYRYSFSEVLQGRVGTVEEANFGRISQKNEN